MERLPEDNSYCILYLVMCQRSLNVLTMYKGNKNENICRKLLYFYFYLVIFFCSHHQVKEQAAIFVNDLYEIFHTVRFCYIVFISMLATHFKLVLRVSIKQDCS